MHMKKIFAVCVAVLMAAGVGAKEYEHSLGMVGGLGIGMQYKTLPAHNFTIIAELGYFICPDGGQGIGYAGSPIANGVFAYQTEGLAEGEGIKLDVYAGGQVKLGYIIGGAGLFGAGAAAGIEANMKNAPIAFSFDFRPGYGLLFADNGVGGTATRHLFDYSLNLGVRYTF